MALRQIALTLLALLGLAAVGDGEWDPSASPAFVSVCFSWTGHCLLSLMIIMALRVSGDLASLVAVSG